MARVIYLWLLCMLGYFYLNNCLIHQWHQPVLTYVEADNTYWLLHIFNIPQTIMQSKLISLLFDCVLIASTFLFFLFPSRSFFCIISIICLWLFQICYGSSAGHRYHHIGFLLVPIPFVFRDKMKFYFTWHAVRYWILFLYICAGLYKLHYGGFFNTQNMASYLQNRYGSNLWPYQSQIIYFLVQHPKLAQLLYQFATLLELSCIVGFFTRKYDRWIALALLLFNLGNLFFMGISFWENSFCLAMLLLPPHTPGPPQAERPALWSYT